MERRSVTGPLVGGPAQDTLRDKIVKAALQAMAACAGKPYTNSGKTVAGLECPGFVAYVYKQVFSDFVPLDTNDIQKAVFCSYSARRVEHPGEGIVSTSF